MSKDVDPHESTTVEVDSDAQADQPKAADRNPPPEQDGATKKAGQPSDGAKSAAAKSDNAATSDGKPAESAEPVSAEEPKGEIPQLTDRVNALVKAIIERLVPESQRIAASLAEVDQRTAATETRVSSIGNFAQRWTDEILAQERRRSANAFDEILTQVMYPIHDHLFTKICAMESGQTDPDPNLINLMQNLEGCLDRIDILVIRPQPGEKFDLVHMESMEAVACRFFRKPDTVARVHRCGFALRHGTNAETTVARKSLVDVYRRT